jgi:ribosome biogenesis GTPase
MQKQPREKNGLLQSSNDQSLSGLVISYFGNSVAVETDDGQVLQCHLKRNQELPVVGDKVYLKLEREENTGLITGIAPRKSLLSRGQGHSNRQPIAANIDVIVIVMSPPPILSEYLIDRYLVAAELLHIQPIIVLNKSDLLAPAERQAVIDRLMPYEKIPYPVMLSSAVTHNGLDELSAYLNNKTAVLVGPSGVGKSSIIAALTQTENPAMRIGDVSTKGAGKHTTTATHLYHLPTGNGNLIDSPGVREFNLWPVSKPDILLSFKEFQDIVSDCKFRDCMHIKEPSCAVQEAVLQGGISPKRYESYLVLMETVNEPEPAYSSKKKNKGYKK